MLDASVVDKNVDIVEGSQGLFKQVFHAWLLSDIYFDGNGAPHIIRKKQPVEEIWQNEVAYP